MKETRHSPVTTWALLAVLLYVGLFFLLKRVIIDPYELSGIPRTHSIRPIYNIVYYPLRWLSASDWRPGFHNGSTESGVLERLDLEHIDLRLNTNVSLSIGFPPAPRFLEHARGVSTGDFVVVELGVQLPKDHDRFVNRPLRLTKQAELGGSANRSQPIGSATNRTSGTAGSGG
jgi:hypothetical protein